MDRGIPKSSGEQSDAVGTHPARSRQRLNVDAALQALYDRRPARFMAIQLGGTYVMVGAIGILGGAIAARYVGQPFQRAAASTAALELSLAISLAWATWRLRDLILLLRDWTSREREFDEAARAVATTEALTFPRRLLIAIVWRVLLLTPATAGVVFAFRGGHPDSHFSIVIAGSLFLILYGATIGYFAGEFSWRPVRIRLGRGVDRSHFASINRVSLRVKLLGGVTALSMVLGFLGIAFSIPPETPVSQTVSLLIVAVGVVPVLGLMIGIPLMRTILEPVHDLIEGTTRVARDDLSFEAPVTSADELGELAVSFNDMVAGLREREALREHNEGLVGELQASRTRIVTASDEARRRVERDLHDGAQQHLVLLNLKLGLLEKNLSSNPERAAKMAAESRADLARALEELRNLAHGIYPSVLENDGLAAALGDAAERAAIATAIECEDSGRYPPELEAAVYFCCLEALQNAAKHAGEGASATISLSQHDGELRFEVADDGFGFDPTAVNGSSGLQNMADRIGALGGELELDSAPDQGTVVTGKVPLKS